MRERQNWSQRRKCSLNSCSHDTREFQHHTSSANFCKENSIQRCAEGKLLEARINSAQHALRASGRRDKMPRAPDENIDITKYATQTRGSRTDGEDDTPLKLGVDGHRSHDRLDISDIGKAKLDVHHNSPFSAKLLVDAFLEPGTWSTSPSNHVAEMRCVRLVYRAVYPRKDMHTTCSGKGMDKSRDVVFPRTVAHHLMKLPSGAGRWRRLPR